MGKRYEWATHRRTNPIVSVHNIREIRINKRARHHSPPVKLAHI